MPILDYVPISRPVIIVRKSLYIDLVTSFTVSGNVVDAGKHWGCARKNENER